MGLYEPDEEPEWLLDPPIYPTVHKLRDTRKGIQQLQETGRFRQYQTDRLDNRLFRANGKRPFIGWDGEGWTDNDGEHRYMLMMCSTGDHIEYPLLDSVSCLQLILKVGADNRHLKPIHVIYGGGYDVTHILRDMPRPLREKLLTDGSVTWKSYTLEYLPHKWFTVTGYHEGKRIQVKMFDVMTFFQSSFVNALKSRKIDVSEVLTQGKDGRANFTFADMDTIKVYCQNELESLVMLCNQLRDEFIEMGLRLNQWYGPGAVAAATLRKYNVDQYRNPPTPELEEVIRHAYFGGRFELFQAGHYPNRVYTADINSAYPHALRSLPNLSHGVWEATTEYDPNAIGVWYCRLDSGGSRYEANPFPWRANDGTVGFPNRNAGVWVWSPETTAVTRTLGTPDIEHGFVFHPADTSRPFGFIEGMYRARQEWKAKGKGGEKALKLAMNSIYGKLAQRVGGKGDRPRWHQLEWAGLITSTCRAMIWEAISLDPTSVISVETDSVTTTRRLDLDYGTGLGQWEYEEYDWVTYLQSGVYFSSKDAKGKSKTRGIDVRELDHSSVIAYLARINSDGRTLDDHEKLLVSNRNFISITNPSGGLYGQWQDGIKEVAVGGGKRLHWVQSCSSCAAGLTMADGLHRMMSNPMQGHVPSTGHPLPWLNPDDYQTMVDGEMRPVGTDAIEEWR